MTKSNWKPHKRFGLTEAAAHEIAEYIASLHARGIDCKAKPRKDHVLVLVPKGCGV